MPSRALVRSLLSLALVLVPLAARADAPPSGPKARLQRSADRAVAEGQLAEARDLWLQLWQLEPSEKAACNVGQLSFRIGDMPRAAEFLTACLERTPAPADAGARARYQSRALDLARAKQAVGALTFAVPRGAELSVDGRPVGRAPLGRAVFVAPGSHRVRAALGEAAQETAVEVRAGDARQVVLDPTAPADTGAAAARPPARVEPGAAAPRPPAPRPPAPRPPAARPPARAEPGAPPGAGPAPGLVLLGTVASAGCVTLGAVLLARSGEHERRFDDLLERNHGGYRIAGLELQRAQRAYSAMELAQERAAVALTAGALLATATLFYAFYPRSTPRSGGARLTAVGTRLHLEAAW
ncbi:hypothetical protein [Sorangium sp. Soce836]|uniref:PEGA domain-containing protein n=2 Tax=Sorangium cellulosum TaxID=56 RepID=A0A4V0NH75_SORCE|nr:hypothetical protein [Sorangium sp. Soce836]AUX35692.1 uncharacterized protein SOCE836_078900 [Sorangium cellulosum]WCQ94993.1 hypothetical protein NQZ70_07768 [Sorangium sp. Soce836]